MWPPSLSLLPLSLLYPPTHTHTQTHTHPLSLYLSLYLSHSLPLSLAFSFTQSLFTLSLFLSLLHTHSLYLSLSLSQSNLSLSLSHSWKAIKKFKLNSLKDRWWRSRSTLLMSKQKYFVSTIVLSRSSKSVRHLQPVLVILGRVKAA